MPYRSNADLPLPVRNHLPRHAQDIHREAFNHAFASHADDRRQEQAAYMHRMGRAEAILCQIGRRPGLP